MPIRLNVVKQNGQGEQVVFDICQWNPVTGTIVHKTVADMQKLLDECLAFGDLRVMELNNRMFEAYQLAEYFEPSTWQRVIALFDILAGRQSAAMVKQRWDSIKEENAALAEGRQQHINNVGYKPDHYNTELQCAIDGDY